MENRKLTIDCILKLLDQTPKINLSLKYIFPSKELYHVYKPPNNNDSDEDDDLENFINEYFYVKNVDKIYQFLFNNNFFDNYIYSKGISHDFDILMNIIKNSKFDIEDFINENCSVTKVDVVFQDTKDIDNIIEIIDHLRYKDREKLSKRILGNTYSIKYIDEFEDKRKPEHCKDLLLHIYSNDKNKLNKYLSIRFNSIKYNIEKIYVNYLIEEDEITLY
jgi:hypothetical protein